jgi:non-heme chloroperoxidase
MTFTCARCIKVLLVTFLLLFTLGLGTAARASVGDQVRQYTVMSRDGVALSVQEFGNPSGLPVVLVHGLMGSHLSWQAQLRSSKLKELRLIAYDMRGHGQSGGPNSADSYTDGTLWAADLEAVIKASGAQRPVLVGWSLGAAVISIYLAAYGDAGIAGAVYVGGVVELTPTQLQPQPEVYRAMVSTDLRTRLDAERAFLGLCFFKPPSTGDFERLLANAALASFSMKRSVHQMTVDAQKGLSTMRKPMLQIYGERDALVHPVNSARRARELNPAIRTVFYPNVGHAPFMEAPDRFNDDLIRFAKDASRGSPS